jgi:pyruvate/2-oxoglutarate dehydrogenase complex dihydrolipoamide acyltransferase (E2) component
MSNFFSRLVARSLDPASAIQPRLASRFEPGGPSLVYDGNESILEEQVVEVAGVPGRSPVGQPTSEASRPRRPAPIPGLENEPALKSGTAAAEMRAQPAVRDFEEAPAQLTHDGRENQARQQNGFVVDAPPAVPEAPISPAPVLKIRRGVSPVSNSAGQSSFPVRSRENDWTHATAAPPIVQVSIGRVEVRAVLPAMPVQGKNSQAANKISLHDHLRNGGHR